MATRLKQKHVLFLISAALTAATLVAYEPVRHNDFVRYDDPLYIAENPNVKDGIKPQSVIWAFTKSHASNWHPITWLSHMLDCQIYGLNPLGHHITNLLIHIANSILLFLLLSRMTGATWRSAFVAAAFALHPLHVESVAWAAERKDVLSGLFWMLTILAYMRYAKQPNIGRYMLVMLAFVMGLMSKPMVVTLPFVLLLLDYWPLERLTWQRNANEEQQAVTYRKASAGHLVTEKIPMFLLSATASVITLVTQKQAVAALENLSIPIRVINALGCYFNYVIKMIYPKDLAVLYPVPDKTSTDSALLAVMGVVLLLVLWGKGRRWLVMGLLWFLGTLVPVIGLVQVGSQIMADRYTYLPSIGVFIIIAWGAEELFTKMRYPKAIPALGAVAVIIAMVLTTRTQVGYWQDSPTLYKRAIAVTKNNFVMHTNYGEYLCEQGQYEEGIQHLREAVRINPDYLAARVNLCTTLLAQGKLNEAIACLTKALQERNDWPNTEIMLNNLGWAYEQKGDLAQAEINYRKSLAIKPDYAPSRKNLARVLTRQNKMTGPQATE
jgi:tetratricopeptide (TPR) repeat protein